MRNPQEIISEIRGFISSQNPMRFPHQETILVDLLNELEVTLFPTEETVVEEPIVKTVVEEVVVKETVTEEPTVEVVVPKTTTRKK
jgi:hypothetical protein